MSDLINRQDAIEVLTETIAPPSVTLDTLVMRIDALPSAEAVQGEWIDNHNGTFTCDQCGCKHSRSNFCPNCGARMKGCDSE